VDRQETNRLEGEMMATFLLIMWLGLSFLMWAAVLAALLLGLIIVSAIFAGANNWPNFKILKD
jgi:hypothetical protein